jgi:predicted dehydrogenase
LSRRHVLAALRAGVRHVLVDKPLATTMEDCLAVARARGETGAHLAIGFNMRHLPVIETIKQVIDNGEIGDLMLIENREFYDGGRPTWRAGIANTPGRAGCGFTRARTISTCSTGGTPTAHRFASAPRRA